MPGPKSVAVVGATGYAGGTVASLLANHPMVSLSRLTSRSFAGKRFAEVWPTAGVDLELAPETDPGDAEVVVVALPHGLSGGLIPGWRREGRYVVDLGADFRLSNPADYERWYGAAHPAPGLLAEAAFGLPELARGSLPGAGLVACPGCYSTAAILALWPAVKAGLVKPDITVDAASGISGAGRSLALNVHFAEAAEDFKAYAVEGHRHSPEMAQALSLDGFVPRITFVPHLLPMVRGILATCYLDLAEGAGFDQLLSAYRSAYAAEPFVHVVDAPPRTKQVSATNQCLIHVTRQGDKVIVLAALDNLLKGASGQAVQALNLVMGWPEETALLGSTRWP